jgi:membrane-bound metal-dependent hydrolase YbcI (DUF457 family)
MAFDNSDYFADGTPPLRRIPEKTVIPSGLKGPTQTTQNISPLTCAGMYVSTSPRRTDTLQENL